MKFPLCVLRFKGRRYRQDETMIGSKRSVPRRGFIQQPRVSEAQPWVAGHPSHNLKGFHKDGSSTMTELREFVMSPDVAFVEPFQGSRSRWRPTQGCATLTLGCWMKPLRGTDRKTPETRGRAAEQPDAGDATAVSTVHSDCTACGFDGRQELTEWAPLIFVRSAAEDCSNSFLRQNRHFSQGTITCKEIRHHAIG